MISSVSKITQTYATNKISTTADISAYNDTSSARSLSRIEQMQEKYKDVYLPMPPSYSEEVENLQTNLIREKYPDYLPLQQALEKYAVKIDIQNPQSKEELEILQKEKTTQIVQEQGEDYYTKGVIDLDCSAYEQEIINKYPNNLWDRPGVSVSNSKELASFYNAGVYEGLESGKELNEAKTIAGHTVMNFMDMSDYWDFSSMHQKLAEQDSNNLVSSQSFNNYSQSVDYDLRIDLREYGFDMELHSHNYSNNEQDMLDFSQKKLDHVNFIINNQDILDTKFNKLNSSFIRSRNSYEDIVKPALEYKPLAQMAVNIFSQYKIFNSIDIKA